jgi:hypothetical protein
MSQGITEILALGVPAFIPSPVFLQQLQPYDLATIYCSSTDHMDAYRAEELKHGRVSQPSGTSGPLVSTFGLSVEWLKLAEYYQYDGVVQFDSFNELFRLLYAVG